METACEISRLQVQVLCQPTLLKPGCSFFLFKIHYGLILLKMSATYGVTWVGSDMRKHFQYILSSKLSCYLLYTEASQLRLLLSSSQSCSPSPNSLIPIRLLGAQQSGFMGWCCTWVWCLIKYCDPASWSLRLLQISHAFIWAQESPWTWEVQRQHLPCTQIEREIPSGLYKPLQIYKGFCPGFRFIWTHSSFPREHANSFPM